MLERAGKPTDKVIAVIADMSDMRAFAAYWSGLNIAPDSKISTAAEEITQVQTHKTTIHVRALRAFRTFSIALMLAGVALTGSAANNSTSDNAKTCTRLGVTGAHLGVCTSLLPRVLKDRQYSGDTVNDTRANAKACARLGATGAELSSCVGFLPNILKEPQRNDY